MSHSKRPPFSRYRSLFDLDPLAEYSDETTLDARDVVVSLLSPLIIVGWVVPLVSGVPPRWPWVITESLMIAVITYVARARSARFLSGLVAVSLAALVLYAVMTHTHGFPQAPAERTSWLLVVALPVFGIVLGAWMLRQPPARRSS